MKLTCPSCGQKYDLGPEAYGRKVQCACGQRFYVEEPKRTPSSEEAKVAEPASSVATAEVPAAQTASASEVAAPSEPVAKKASVKADIKKRTFRTPNGTGATTTPTKAASASQSAVGKKSRSGALLLVVALLLAIAGGGYWWWQQQSKADGQVVAETEANHGAVAASTTPVPVLQVARSDRAIGDDYLLTDGGDGHAAATFDTATWKRQYANPATFKFEKWPTPYNGGPGFSWWEPKSSDCGNRWFAYLGPLGVQVRSLNATFQQHAGFDAAFPDEMKDAEGRLVRNALLVTKVFAGAPAEGYLQEGDLILGIEGEELQDAMLIDPTTDYRTKNVRNLALHAGWLLDRAEGRGKIDLRVLRGLLDRDFQEQSRVRATTTNRIQDVAADLGDARFVKLEVNGTEGNTDYRWANWVEPKLTGAGKPDIDLSQAEWLTGTCGWRKIQRGLDVTGKEVEIDGKVVKALIGTHAKSEIVFRVPEGYDRFSARLHLGGKRTIEGRVLVADEAVQKRVSRSYEKRFVRTIEVGGELHDGPALSKDVRTANFNVALNGATEVSLETRGNPSHHSGWSNWLEPRLLGSGKEPIDLTKTDWLSARTGWGRVRHGADVNGDPIMEAGKIVGRSIGAHADSALTWTVPEGYTHLHSRFQLGSPRGTIIPSVRAKRGYDLALDVDLVDAERVLITCTDAGLHLHNLRLHGDAGAVTGLAVLKQERVKYRGEDKLLELRANSNSAARFEILVPPGQWRLRADVEVLGKPGTLAVSTLRRAPFPEYFKPYAKQVSFPVQRIGSFKEGFPGDHCAKTGVMTELTAAWLLAQQQEDGSWPRRAGYCSPAMDTSIAVLALLAADKPQYESAIRKGVEYMAYRCSYRDWVYPSAMALIATSEYYLRTKEDWVLPVIETHVERCRKFVYGDFTCGHGANPGYGDGGVNYGGAHLALGYVLAAKTPVGVDKRLVDGLMWRVQSLSPGGYVPYTRSVRSTFDDKPPTSYAAGARTGIYLTAAQLHGGPQHFIDHAVRHLCERTLGGGDQGHASKIFSMMGSTLGIAVSDERSFHEHARRYGWALTLTRRFDGGFHWNSELLEYMGAESVMNTVYRSATYVLLLNAYKKNLGITGRADLMPGNQGPQALPKLTDTDRRIWHYYRTNWQVVRAALGSRTPAVLEQACRELDSLERTAGPDMIARVFSIVNGHGPRVVTEIRAIDHPQKAKLIEMVLGVDVRVDVSVEKENPKKGKITMTAQHPFAGRLWNADNAEVEDWKAKPPIPFRGTMTLNGELLAKTETLAIDEKVDWRKGTVSRSIGFDLGDKESSELKLEVDYLLGGNPGNVARTIRVPHTRTNNRIVHVDGVVARDHLRHSVSLTLADGTSLECVNVSFEGKSDIAIPVQYRGKELFSDVRPLFPLVEHTVGRFGYQSDLSRVVPVAITDAKVNSVPTVAIQQMTVNDSDLVDATVVEDWSFDTATKFKLSKEGEATVVCDFAAEFVPAKYLLVLGKGASARKIEAWAGSEWRVVAGGDARNALQYLIPQRTKRIRITIGGRAGRDVELKELHWYKTVGKKQADPQAGL
jgi:hypothetical protein